MAGKNRSGTQFVGNEYIHKIKLLNQGKNIENQTREW
jgi:hypothetical protein